MFEETEIVRFNLKEGKSSLKDRVVREIPFTLKVDDIEVATLLSSPMLLKELAVGYLFVEGFISSISDIKDIFVNDKAFFARVETKGKIATDQLQKSRVITSGCGRNISFYNAEDFKNCPPVESDLTVGTELVLSLMKEFQNRSEVFKETGGVHSAALCEGDKIISFAEDIGRHNAVDKIVGGLILKKEDPCLAGRQAKNKFLLLSGRISSEMLLKAARIGIPIIVSRSAPTDMAVRLAKQLKVTLVGFARGSRMNVYSEKGRIICQK